MLNSYCACSHIRFTRKTHSARNDPPSGKQPLDFEQHEDNELSTGCEHVTFIQSSTERRGLIEEQDKEYIKALKADQQKEHKKQKELENARVMEQLRREREAKVPEDPHIEEDHVVVSVRHLGGGIVTLAFFPNSVMQAVYDWIGSLQ